MRRLLVLLIGIGLGAGLVGCGDDDPGGAATDDEPADDAGSAGDRYEFVGTVVETAESEGAELCIGASIAIYPPQCGGIPIDRWNWNEVPGAQSEGRTAWVDQVRVVGTFDGGVFSPTETPSVPEGVGGPAIDVMADFPPLCTPSPSGERTSDDDFQAASAAADALPTRSAFWVSGNARPVAERVINVIVSGDGAAATSELQDLWGGGLCVVERPETPTEAQLDEINGRLPAVVGDDYLGGWTDPTRGLAIAQVIVATDDLRAKADQEFGPGTVELSPALRRL